MGIIAAIAGLSTQLDVPRSNSAVAITTPEWPALTKPSASPFLTSSQALLMDESFFFLIATEGDSSILTVCEACLMDILLGGHLLLSSSALIDNSSPTRMMSISSKSLTVSIAPSILTAGA